VPAGGVAKTPVLWAKLPIRTLALDDFSSARGPFSLPEKILHFF
jgi:hypothetical protein